MMDGNLQALERYFYRTYRGQVPDIDTYNQAVNDYLTVNALPCNSHLRIVNGKYVTRSRDYGPSRPRKKALIIDAILTIKHASRIKYDGLHKSAECFDMVQQLEEVN